MIGFAILLGYFRHSKTDAGFANRTQKGSLLTMMNYLAPFERIAALALLLTIGFLVSATKAQTGNIPIPTSKRQQEIAKVLEDGFGVAKAKTPSEKQQLVKSLLTTATDPALPKDELYVVLRTIIEQSQQLRDLPTMTTAVEQLVTAFEVDSFAERSKQLVKYLDFVNAKTSTTLKPVFDEISTMAISTAADNRYRDALKLLDDVDAKLVALKVPGSSKQSLTDLRKEIAAKKEKFEMFQLARSVLETKPDDPDSNFTVGYWLVTEESNWKLALPHLAKGSKIKTWQSAAALELSPETDALKVGDEWWAIAESESDSLTKRELQLHITDWYKQALPKLSPLLKKRTEDRLKTIAQNTKPAVTTALSGKTSKREQSLVPADARKFGGHSYKFFAEALSWKAAKEKCEMLGGYLVTIESADENKFVGDLVTAGAFQDCWIGITDEAVEGKWRTVTGQAVSFTNWYLNQPNNKEGREHFGIISNREAGGQRIAWRWCDQPNQALSPHLPGFVCEWNAASSTPSDKKALERVKWKEDRGGFVRQPDGSWNQFLKGGAAYDYREIGRTSDYVELAHQGSDLKVRLYDGHAAASRNKSPFKKEILGTWIE